MRFTAEEIAGDKCTRDHVPTKRNQCSLQDMEAICDTLRRVPCVIAAQVVEKHDLNCIRITVLRSGIWDTPQLYPHRGLERLAEFHEGKHAEQLQPEHIAAAA